MRWVRDHFDCLTERQQIYIELRYFRGMSYGEIGVLMQTSRPCVYRAVKRAERTLHKAAVQEGLAT